MRQFIFSLLLLIFTTGVSVADEKTIYLIDQQGQSTAIGHLKLTPSSKGSQNATVSLDETRFTDHFLSMRPFKCITAPTEYQLCYLPYPYEIKRVISAEDLTDLEYKLLFIHRGAKDYGINPWFGVYYQLSASDAGDTFSWEGSLHDIDLDILASPPENGNLRPLVDDEIHKSEAAKHFWPKLVIY